MKITIFKQDISEYLICDAVIDFDHPSISKLAEQLYRESNNETDFVRRAYEYVRDGICFAKSHLLVAVREICQDARAGGKASDPLHGMASL